MKMLDLKKKFHEVFEICKAYYTVRKDFNLIKEIKILRIDFVGIRKILKRDAFLKIEKINPDKWETLFQISNDIFVNWTKFLTVYVNDHQRSGGSAQQVLDEAKNEYPTLMSQNESDREKKDDNEYIQLPDFVELMLNFKKYVKRKLKCNPLFDIHY